MKRELVLGLVVTSLIAIASGVAHGLLDSRWQAVQSSDRKVLDSLPEQLGDWVLMGKDTLEPHAQSLLRCDDYLYRTYRNGTTNQQVTLAVLHGPRGPIAVHTPDICYVSKGVEPVGPRKLVKLEEPQQENSFWFINFQDKKGLSGITEVAYAWSDGGAWVAAKEPRYWPTFQLFKIQVAGKTPDVGMSAGCKEFLKEIEPHLSALLRKDF